MNKHIFTTIFFAIFMAPAFAQDTQACKATQDPDARLTCYDNLFGAPELSVSSAPEGNWRVQSETSPLDDSKRVFMFLDSNEGVAGRFGGVKKFTLVLACRENTTSAYINFGGHFMSSIQGKGRVTYRLDSASAQTKNFRESSNNESLGLWNGGTSIPFIKSMFGHASMYVQAQPFSDSTIADTFDITGLETSIAPLRDACNW